MNEAVILLDTNVVSELMRPKPAQAVLDWFAAQDSTKLFFSAVSEAELRTGAAILPAGKRRDSLTATIDSMITEDFAGRVLRFDSAAARAYAAIAANRRAAGQPIMEADCQIAAMALSQRDLYHSTTYRAAGAPHRHRLSQIFWA